MAATSEGLSLRAYVHPLTLRPPGKAAVAGGEVAHLKASGYHKRALIAPTRPLASGAEIPVIGLGTFGSDRYGPAEVANAVKAALQVGYRHVDCAAVYGNEREVGAAIRSSGVPRGDLWVTGKLWNDRHADPEAACEDSLNDLGLEYFDLYLIHWPFPNYHAPGVGVNSRDPHARPYIHAEYMQTWRALERLVHQGYARHIGTSNMTRPKLELLLRDALIRPVANEMELHPHFQQTRLFEYVLAESILPIGYSPLGSPSRPVRDRTPQDTSDLEDPVVNEIAARRGITPADVCIKWAVKRGQIPIPFSVKLDQIQSSLRAVVSEPLTVDEMRAIETVDMGCRLIKGQVFLWANASDWHDLWDENGRIATDHADLAEKHAALHDPVCVMPMAQTIDVPDLTQSVLRRDWMRALSDSLPISRVSIPGAHDAGTALGRTGITRCQSLTIPAQLAIGIRGLDIRLRLVNSDLQIYHGDEYQRLDFPSVMAALAEFLAANSSEALVVRISREAGDLNAGGTFEAAFSRHIAPYDRLFYRPETRQEIPTLRRLRGKILILDHFGKLSPGIDYPNSSMRVQDDWRISDMDKKLREITDAFEDAIADAGRIWHVSYTSSCSESVDQLANARAINPRVLSYIRNRKGSLGLVFMNFPSVELVHRVIDSNP